ncbi:hypothetical protein GCM10011591_03620 [Nocardia camponoti]|uniref:HEAT repeat domain-containing protein n=1 Tax=Nocardia camponoti TaxID=1616106 RepID=A0A917Q9Z2_9NOCA|nr:hypothetical protein GCM10011591_03620 [Nocardia camponoti]
MRLSTALAIGTHVPDGLVGVLVERCAIEPDFYVRDMLTWALTRYPRASVVPALRAELRSARAQARSQALHTLSKIGDASVWPDITSALLRDPDVEVARSAWRAAVVLVPDAEKGWLAVELTTQLGRGATETQRSLSRALVELGDHASVVIAGFEASADPVVRAHAVATRALLNDPDAAFELNVAAARRAVALGAVLRADR